MKPGRGQNIKYRPYAFTEHGAIQAANVLSSPRAVEMGVFVVRAFVKLREMLASNKELGQKVDELERKLQTHDRAIVDILRSSSDGAATRAARAKQPKRGLRHADRRVTVGRIATDRTASGDRELQESSSQIICKTIDLE